MIQSLQTCPTTQSLLTVSGKLTLVSHHEASCRKEGEGEWVVTV